MGMGNGHEDGDGGGMEWAVLGDLLLGRRLVWSGLLCSGSWSWSWSCVFVKMRPQITEAVTIFRIVNNLRCAECSVSTPKS